MAGARCAKPPVNWAETGNTSAVLAEHVARFGPTPSGSAESNRGGLWSAATRRRFFGRSNFSGPVPRNSPRLTPCSITIINLTRSGLRWSQFKIRWLTASGRKAGS